MYEDLIREDYDETTEEHVPPPYEVRRTGHVPTHPDPEVDARLVARYHQLDDALRRAAKLQGTAVWYVPGSQWVPVDPANAGRS